MSMLVRIAVVIAALGGAGCYAEPGYYGGATYAGSYDDTTYATTDGYTDPPAEYVATTEPVYYGGRANYYYNNSWRYHERGRWGGYRSEPAGLRQYRPQRGGYSAPQRRYEGGSVRGGARTGGFTHASGGAARGGGGRHR
jgi:hypothetical protein